MLGRGSSRRSGPLDKRSVPRFEPFAGIRYAPNVDLSAATAPPYDVISRDERAALAGGHPANAVHLDLPDEADGSERYRMAATTLSRLLDEGTLRVDAAPAFYAYRMSFLDETGVERRTTGVLGALELTRPAEGQILPHEHTTPKAKSDRLDLLRATGYNHSPIWALTPVAGLATACLTDRPADAECTDGDGVHHELWVMTDPATHDAIRAIVAARPVVVADGHHRYETSLAYRDERRADHDGGDWDSTLALVVELADDELHVRAIHRLVRGLPDGLDLAAALASWFDVSPTTVSPTTPADMVEAGALVLVLPGGSARLLRAREGAFGPEVADLDSARLATALAALPPHEVVYQHGVDQIVAALEEPPDGGARFDAGFLLRPATVAQIAATAEGGERMPPKTTFFWPKPRTGFVYRKL